MSSSVRFFGQARRNVKSSTLKRRETLVNRLFPSPKKSHFQNGAKCETFVVKMSFICIIIKNHFHVNGFALSLALKVIQTKCHFFCLFVFIGGILKKSWLNKYICPSLPSVATSDSKTFQYQNVILNNKSRPLKFN